METEGNPEIINSYHILTIVELLKLYKDEIDKVILSKAEETLPKILKKYPGLSAESIQQDYDDRFFFESGGRLSCQTQIANNLRLFNHGNVRT